MLMVSSPFFKSNPVHMRHLALYILFWIALAAPVRSDMGVKGSWIQRLILEPGFQNSNTVDKVADLSFGFDLQFLNWRILQGLGIAAGYRYQVAPAYQKQHHSRIDHWRLNMNLSPGDLVADALDLPIRFRIGKDREILFIRFFPTKKEAHLATPYHLGQVPISAKRAREYLNPGDLVIMPARLNLMVSAQLGKRVGLLKAKVGSHLMFSGEFQIHVLRMRDEKVRLRVVASRQRQDGYASAKLGGAFKLFGLNFEDSGIVLGLLFLTIVVGELFVPVPIWSQLYHKEKQGWVLQSSGFSCVPASLCNLMAQEGLQLKESDLARELKTSMKGTHLTSVLYWLKKHKFDAERIVLNPDTTTELSNCIVTIDHPATGPDSHAAYLHTMNVDLVQLVDPLSGIKEMKREDFLKVWKGQVLRLIKD